MHTTPRHDIRSAATELEECAAVLRGANDPEMIREVLDRLGVVTTALRST